VRVIHETIKLKVKRQNVKERERKKGGKKEEEANKWKEIQDNDIDNDDIS